ncbi:MAG: F0F1 ATP synthase subunit B [Anaerolineae bacterium]|nr:F0F1 ATP synthase subunit B [Anaerolineae bacterium]
MGEALGELGINGPFLLSQAVNFLILFGLLTVLLWKPAMRRLEERREMLRKQEEDAKAVAQARTEMEQEKARVLEQARAEANQVLVDAREQARDIAKQANARAREEAEKFMAQARESAQEERNALLGQMRGQIASLAIAAAHQLIGESLDEQRQRALVASFFSGLRDGRVAVLPDDVKSVEGPVIVTSAVPLTAEEQEAVRQDLAARLGQDVALSFQVDPQILGGLILRLGDRVIDGGVAGQLEQLHRSLA